MADQNQGMDYISRELDALAASYTALRLSSDTALGFLSRYEQLVPQPTQVIHARKRLTSNQDALYEVPDFCKLSRPNLIKENIVFVCEDIEQGIPHTEQLKFDHNVYSRFITDSTGCIVGLWHGWYEEPAEAWQDLPTGMHSEDLYLALGYCREEFPDLYRLAEENIQIPPIGLEDDIAALKAMQGEVLNWRPVRERVADTISDLALILRKLIRGKGS